RRPSWPCPLRSRAGPPTTSWGHDGGPRAVRLSPCGPAPLPAAPYAPGVPVLSEPWIYAWPPSVAPGEPVALRVAGPPGRGEVVVARIGATREVVWRGAVAIEPHDLPADAA